MKIKENKKATPQVGLAQKTWTLVQDVASSEKSANGKMLFISRNLFQLFLDNKMDFQNYFGKEANDIRPESIFFEGNGQRKTLIAKDYSLFTNQVIIPALGQNLADVQKHNPYEYRVMIEATPLVMFLINNSKTYKGTNFLNEETDPVQFNIFWNIVKTKDQDLDEHERVFREAIQENFFMKAERGKDYYTTFRGDRGVIDFVKAYFMPKKIASDNVKNAVESPLYKTMTKLNDLQKGEIGTTHNLTNVAKAEQGKGGNADQRLLNEVNQIKQTTEKFIDLLAKNNNPIAQKALLDVYLYVVDKLETGDNFKEYIKAKTKAKVEFTPTINSKTFDSISGDFYKYVSNFK